ncbi:sulfate reduction electron transfer complex DsrMKJOP subunit DsrM [Dethiosulfatarculus sandiegensis]|uniref:Menaquinol oxidoreductase n=1 Tax=Dethiosulfatarculus sandiegensis TaxID=1429043 RepID=A0A0D2JCI6_9BACT|nr:sulfate reduction electron transfer complex DsrMKJOP subunit DsrM [Dethiosulfatarculus sandiegensis]KIX13461.1 menaquinol oxidoreductase [Dethiosulfatarculus sandiegensis]
MGAIVSFIAVLILIGVAYLGAAQAGMQSFFGVVIPYAAVATFVIGFVLKVINWGKSPVPFRIPTTCGQAQSLPWIKQSKLDNPSTTGGVVLRMALEILCFRSLFRNTQLDYRDGPKIRYGSEKFLWLGAIAFHYSFLTVLIWHFRFFMEPVPWLVKFIEATDGFLQVGLPQLLISGVVLLAAAGFLFWRRVYYPQIRYISLASDYFPLFLIMAIAITGILMRYFTKVDIVAVKELTMSLVAFNPFVPEGIGSLFYIHVFLVSILFAYFPFSKLMHMGGVFLSPTRNLPNDSRAKRHVNPWNYPVKTHTYEEYEDDFREEMKEVGLPLDKE